MYDLYARDPDQGAPRLSQAQAVWAWLDVLSHAFPDRWDVQGARHAAEWALGLTDIPPVTGRKLYHDAGRVDAANDPGDIHRELKAYSLDTRGVELDAAMTAARREVEPRDRDRALGAAALLAWWEGSAPIADFLRPSPRNLPAWQRKAGAA